MEVSLDDLGEISYAGVRVSDLISEFGDRMKLDFWSDMRRKRKKNRALPPRCKRMKRSGRLQSAVSWLREYRGKNVLRGYCRHFGVDWRCAAIELRQLGVTIDEDYLERRADTERQLVMARQHIRDSQAAAESDSEWPPYDSVFEAYLAGDFAAQHVLERESLS